MIVNEQTVQQILSSIQTHTPEQIILIIITLEDPSDVDYVFFHPTVSDQLRERLDYLAQEGLGPIQEELKRVQEERKRVQEELKRVQEELKRVQEELKRVQEAIMKADLILEDIQEKRSLVKQFNNAVEGQREMYRELNSQIDGSIMG